MFYIFTCPLYNILFENHGRESASATPKTKASPCRAPQASRSGSDFTHLYCHPQPRSLSAAAAGKDNASSVDVRYWHFLLLVKCIGYLKYLSFFSLATPIAKRPANTRSTGSALGLAAWLTLLRITNSAAALVGTEAGREVSITSRKRSSSSMITSSAAGSGFRVAEEGPTVKYSLGKNHLAINRWNQFNFIIGGITQLYHQDTDVLAA